MRSNLIVHLRRIAARKQSRHCYYCNCLMSGQCAQLSCTAEHLIPRANKGKDSKVNIVAACKFCNAMRHLSPAEYLKIVRNLVSHKMWHQNHSAWSSFA